ncbi:hypothetical protein ACFL2A_05900 [Thermodesulfobacteriota bacterium]
MFKRILNNINHDIKGNYSLIAENAGYYQAMLYLSKASISLCKAVILNKKRDFQHIEFYDTWI